MNEIIQSAAASANGDGLLDVSSLSAAERGQLRTGLVVWPPLIQR